MKGWRPSACPLARRLIGLGATDVFLPDIGSIGRPFPRPRLVRGHQGSLFRGEAPRPTSRAEKKTAPALHLLNEAGETGNEDLGTDEPLITMLPCHGI